MEFEVGEVLKMCVLSVGTGGAQQCSASDGGLFGFGAACCDFHGAVCGDHGRGQVQGRRYRHLRR
jgi:hypothetical protein